MSPVVGLALVGALIAANALFVAAEFALVAAQRGPIEERAQRGERRARAALEVMRNLSFMLSGAQFGITATSLLVGYLAEPSLGRMLAPVVELVGLPAGSVLAVSVTAAFVVSTVLQMVVGELAPKNLAIARPQGVSLALAPFMRAYGLLFGPVIRLFDESAGALSRRFGVDVREELLEPRSREELARIIAVSGAEGSLREEQAELLLRAVELGDRRVSEIMVARPDIVWLADDDPLVALREAARSTGHSRFPVRGTSEDDVVGTVHIKDLLPLTLPTVTDDSALLDRTVGEVAAEPLIVPESTTLRRLFAGLRTSQRTFAVVADEFGGTAGIVTVEDVVEELVGEIEDEFDADAVSLRRAGAGRYLVSGGVRVDRLAEHLGADLPDGDYETVAGLVIDELGRIPRRGDVVERAGLQFTVLKMDGRRVVQLLLRRVQPHQDGDGGDAGGPS